ncbi:hypothetical protein M405DRAFT_912581, partial [Rhizopogon salebrosus TDB-379]
MRLERVAVASTTYNMFSCAMCMDEHPVDNTLELGCNHQICRGCIRRHVHSRIEEYQFPVHCPMCMTEQNDQAAVISGPLVQRIGIDERQYAIWVQMESSHHSVIILCHHCQRSVSVDRQEHEASEVLICPLPDCNHSWCKVCQQPITIDDPPHSCEGTATL